MTAFHSPVRRAGRTWHDWRARLNQEAGAQAAEYAMLGGVGAAACGALIAIVRDKHTLTRLAEAVFDGLAKMVGSWF